MSDEDAGDLEGANSRSKGTVVGNRVVCTDEVDAAAA